MKKIAIVVTVLLFLSLGAFIYGKTGGDISIVSPTSLAVQSMGDKVENTVKTPEISGDVVKKQIPNNIKITPFRKTIILPRNGKELSITENGVFLKSLDGRIFARHQKIYLGKWAYVGEVIQGDLKVFNGKKEETNIIVMGPETTGVKVKVSGAVSD